jgi:L-ascorbate metabolism protein UlaG (beta-lactamase superfamily)
VKIRFLGHASFLVTSAGGTKIVFDPYEPGGFNGAITYGRLTEPADVVVITHEHADHSFAAGVLGSPQVIKGPGVHSAALILLHGIPLKHDSSGGSERGDNTVFCADIDGLRLCHLGDLGHELNPSQAAEIGAVDVLLCPVGGTFTIDATGATQVIRALNPRITIPMHFKTPKIRLPLAPLDDFLRGKKNVHHQHASEITLTRETLPKEPQIMVLDSAL